ncbi:4a-hydroxytetrahydrobiopterin dehydratase [archaeon]|nr:MAG: 4a-hydroxytetrahydrobiopterin dehydratase [archaeon]
MSWQAFALKLPRVLITTRRHNALSASAPNLLTQAERDTILSAITQNGWKVQANRDAIEKKYQFKDFKDAFAFMTMVSDHAERLQHHPEWLNVYNRVEVVLSTHDCSGLSVLDVELAKLMDSISSTFSK